MKHESRPGCLGSIVTVASLIFIMAIIVGSCAMPYSSIGDAYQYGLGMIVLAGFYLVMAAVAILIIRAIIGAIKRHKEENNDDQHIGE